MVKSLILFIIAFLCLAPSAFAQTATNRANLELQTNEQIYANGQEAITGSILNGLMNNYAASMATQLDKNTFTQLQTFAPSMSSGAGVNFGVGIAPTSPNNGDFWGTSAGFYGRVNGVTVGPFAPNPYLSITPGVLGYAGTGTGPATSLTTLPSGLTIPAVAAETIIGSGLSQSMYAPGVRAPLFIWNNPGPNSAGQNDGLQVFVGSNPTATPGAGDNVAATIAITNGNNRVGSFGLNIVTQICGPADNAGCSIANGYLGGSMDTLEIDVSASSSYPNGNRAFNPTNGASFFANGPEIYCDGSGPCTAAFSGWATATDGSNWWHEGLALARISDIGLHFVVNPGEGTDAGTAFGVAAIVDDSNSLDVLKVTGTHSEIFDLSGLASATVPLLKAPTSGATTLTMSNGADYSIDLILSGGNTTAQNVGIDLEDRSTVKWILQKTTANNFVIYNASTGNNSLSITESSDVITFYAAPTMSGLTLSGITGSTQCLQANNSGVVSGTGGACGSAVSSVTNSNGTLTISPTTGAVVASLALAHANSWTGLQTFATGDIAINGGTATAGLATVTSAGVLSSEANATVAQGGTNCTSASITCFNNITGYSASGATGTTSANLVFSSSPSITSATLTTPTLAYGTGSNQFIIASSNNAGYTNAFASENSGSFSGATLVDASFVAALTGNSCTTCTVTTSILGVSASATGLITTGSGVAGGLDIATGAGNILLQPGGTTALTLNTSLGAIFAGTATFVDTSTYTSTGLNNLYSLGVGTTAPGQNNITAAGIIRTSSAGSAAAPSLVVGNNTTGLYSVSTTGLGVSVNGSLVWDYGVTTGSQTTFAGSVNSTGSFIGNVLSSRTVGTAYSITSLPSSTTTSAGNITLGAGNNTNTFNGNGGSIAITAGSATGFGSAGNGGSITLTGGTSVGGTPGNILLQPGGTTVATLTGGGGLQIGAPTGGDKGAGSINVQSCFVNNVACATTGASVASISFGTTGLTPNSATTGAVTVAGTLAVANGGTGITSFGTGVATALGNATNGTGGLVTYGGSFGNATGHASLDLALTGGTLSGVVSIPTADLEIVGSSTGYTAIASANSSTSNYTMTLQAATDTIVGRATTDTLTNKTISGSSNTFSNIANASLSNSTISGVSLGGNLATLTFGTHVTGTSYNGSGAVTIATDATSAATASTIVARDSSGNTNFTNLFIGGGTNSVGLGSYVAINSTTTSGFEFQVAGASIAYFSSGSNYGQLLTASTSIPLYFGTNNAAEWEMDGSGNLIAVTDNTYNIGASGATRPKNIYVSGMTSSAAYASTGTVPIGTTGSCTASSFTGGSTAGKFSAAACTAGTFILSGLPASTNGYACDAEDQTTPGDSLKQTASNTTSVTFTATVAASDAIVYKCIGY